MKPRGAQRPAHPGPRSRVHGGGPAGPQLTADISAAPAACGKTRSMHHATTDTAEVQTLAGGGLQRPAGPLARHADAVFERVSPYDGDGFRNHCRRLFHLTERLMHKDRAPMARDVAYAVAMCHDLGLVSRDDTGPTYLARSRALFERETAGFDLGDTSRALVDECLLYNHRLLPVPNLSPQADAFRRAVQIEHSRGLLRFGLDRADVDAIFERYPRGNFDRVLLDFTWRVLRREPWTLVKGIFF